MLTKNETTLLSQKAAWVLLLTILLAVLAMVLIPVWIIMPFKPQSKQGLELSFALRQWSPVATLIASAAALILAAWLWRNSRIWWRKAAVIVIILPLLVSTWFARQNHFEWMFNPLANTAYAKADDAEFVAGSDMVLAVENNGEAVAYPVRLMAYHHLVQDEVGGTPIIATY